MSEVDPNVNPEIERLIQQAAVARMRNDLVEHRRILDKLKKTAPESPQVLEFLADELWERKKHVEAAAAYAKALKLNPDSVVLQRKHAEAILASHAGDFALMNGMDYESPAGAKAGSVLSLFCPGLGQIVAGNIPRGAAFLIGWLLCLIIAFSLPNGMPGLLSMIGIGKNHELNPLVFLPLFGAGLIHAISFAEMAALAKKVEPKKIERPVPPVDKDFEL
jgi:hypothetical protein